MNNTASQPGLTHQSINQANFRRPSFSTALPQTLILSATGAASVLDRQRSQLEKIAAVQYRANLEPLDPKAFIELAKPYEYLAITRRAIGQMDRCVIEALPRLKGISVYSTGVEWIDTASLQAKNIRFASLPDYCTNAVAETALGLIFMTAHKLHLRYLKSIGTISQNISLRGYELKNRSVGIIGFGKIGQSLAHKIQPLCSSVLVDDIEETRFLLPLQGVRRASKKKILSTCDFIIVCASQQFIQQQVLESPLYEVINPEAVLINVGRTSLLNHKLLINMVKQQRIRAYIYDDLMFETDLPNEFEYGKIVPTGHTSWYTDESIKAGTRQWIQNLVTLCKTP